MLIVLVLAGERRCRAVVVPRVLSVLGFTVTNGKIVQLDALVDPERLAQLDLSFLPITDEHA